MDIKDQVRERPIGVSHSRQRGRRPVSEEGLRRGVVGAREEDHLRGGAGGADGCYGCLD